MCNLSQGIYDKGYDSGVSAGEMKKAKEIAYRLIDKGMSCDEIAEMAEVDVNTVQEWLEELDGMLVK